MAIAKNSKLIKIIAISPILLIIKPVSFLQFFSGEDNHFLYAFIYFFLFYSRYVSTSM